MLDEGKKEAKIPTIQARISQDPSQEPRKHVGSIRRKTILE